MPAPAEGAQRQPRLAQAADARRSARARHRHLPQSEHQAAGGQRADHVEEKQAQVEALTSAQKQQAAAAAASTGTTDPVLLRKLAAEHADEALKEIEAQK